LADQCSKTGEPFSPVLRVFGRPPRRHAYEEFFFWSRCPPGWNVRPRLDSDPPFGGLAWYSHWAPEMVSREFHSSLHKSVETDVNRYRNQCAGDAWKFVDWDFVSPRFRSEGQYFQKTLCSSWRGMKEVPRCVFVLGAHPQIPVNLGKEKKKKKGRLGGGARPKSRLKSG